MVFFKDFKKYIPFRHLSSTFEKINFISVHTVNLLIYFNLQDIIGGLK